MPPGNRRSRTRASESSASSSSSIANPLAARPGIDRSVSGPIAKATAQPASANSSAIATQRDTWPAPIAGEASQRKSASTEFLGSAAALAAYRAPRLRRSERGHDFSESVSELYQGLQSFRSMRRMD